nr:HAMP domain-containing sensor histidine kinase [Terrabacter sp. MAHUQ-38]
MPGDKVTGDRDLVRHAARSTALWVALSTAVVVLLAILATGVVFDRQQFGEITDRTRTAAATADDVVDAPPGIWIVASQAAGHEASQSMPSELLGPTLQAADGPAGETGLRAGGRGYPAWVAHRNGTTYVAVYDISLHHAEEVRLIWSAALAGAAGVILAALIGWLAGRRAVRPLVDALDLQRQFVADASHELRTPLAVVSMRAQLLRRRLGPGLTPELRAEVDRLVADTGAMGDVVADLLLSAQLEASSVSTDSVALRWLALDVVESLEPYAAESGVRLVAPDAGAEVEVPGVQTGLRRAIVALVDNAISHSPQGAEVAVGVAHDEDGARVGVIDHGPGVDPREVGRLTRRFARSADEGSRRRVGLGLALVTQVVRSHGGRLEVAHTPGGGATFTIVLPFRCGTGPEGGPVTRKG